MGVAMVFPGQGAQYVGMGKKLAQRYEIAAKTIAEADEALGFNLSEIIFSGPEEKLKLTYYTQPAILAVSVACLRAFLQEYPLLPAVVAGHSLGEYTALVAAGALEYQDALRLVHDRGKWMDEAVPSGEGAMAAVLGADVDLLVSLCKDITTELGFVVEVANVNCPGQVTVSGATKAVEELIRRASEANARRAIKLDVSGPFHSSMMAPAANKLAESLRMQNWRELQVPLVTNVFATAMTSTKDMIQALQDQLASPVLWEASVRHMAEMDIQTIVEFGPGTVLSGLIKKTDKSLQTQHVEDPDSLIEAVEYFK